MDAAPIIEILRRAVPAGLFEVAPAIDQPTIYIGRDHLVEAARVLRDSPQLRFSLLADLTAVDGWPREPRFEIVYHLASWDGESGAGAPPSARLRVKVRVPGGDAHLPTVAGIWRCANWAEREVWDLFGVEFDGHPDLRRLLMPDDWEGHPLRKDYPVQIDRPVTIQQPLQITPEQFVANVRASRGVKS